MTNTPIFHYDKPITITFYIAKELLIWGADEYNMLYDYKEHRGESIGGNDTENSELRIRL